MVTKCSGCFSTKCGNQAKCTISHKRGMARWAFWGVVGQIEHKVTTSGDLAPGILRRALAKKALPMVVR